MADKQQDEEIDRLARQAAKRLLDRPPEPQKWPGKRKAKAKTEGADDASVGAPSQDRDH